MKYNKALMAGYLIKDPELKVVGQKKTPLCTFCLAVQIDKEQPSVFWNCNAWGKKAELMGAKLHKGSNIFIDARVEQTKDYLDKESGVTRKGRLVLNIQDFQFAGEPLQPVLLRPLVLMLPPLHHQPDFRPDVRPDFRRMM